jgi:hypothetical protein
VIQYGDFGKAMREATLGVIEYVQTGRAPLLSICDGGSPLEHHLYSAAIEAVAEALLDWQMLDGCEVAKVVEEAIRPGHGGS